MKKLILISIFLNVGLVAGVGYFAIQNRTSVANNAPEETATTGKTKTKKRSAKEEVEIVQAEGDRFSWHNVESEDYKNYIANLRSILCPEETVRDIIIADVNKFYASKLKPLRKPVEEWKYWRNDQNWGGRRESDEFYKEQVALEKEKRELLKELLGTDYEKEIAKQYGWADRNKDPFMESLSQETKDKLSEIARKFGEQTSEVHRKAKGYHDEETQEELRKIEKARRAEMAKVLSPEDLFEWELRNSSLAQNLKYNELQNFDASEEEFRAIVKAKLAIEGHRTDEEPTEDKASRDARREAQTEAQNALKAALGEGRYKEYELSQNWEYKELARIADRQGIAKEAVMQVYEMKEDVQKAARLVNADKTLTSEQRREKLLAIKHATEQEVTSSLGERGFKTWKRNAWWLRNIVPPEPSKPSQ